MSHHEFLFGKKQDVDYVDVTSKNDFPTLSSVIPDKPVENGWGSKRITADSSEIQKPQKTSKVAILPEEKNFPTLPESKP